MTEVNDAIHVIRTQGTQPITAAEEEAILSRARGGASYPGVGTRETTVVLYRLQPFDEADSPGDLGSLPHDPASAAGVVNLQPYRQARIRATVDDDPGTADVTGEVQYSIDGGNVYVPLLTATFDFGDLTTETTWEDLPDEVADPDVYVYLKVAVTGTGAATTHVSVFLDLRQ